MTPNPKKQQQQLVPLEEFTAPASLIELAEQINAELSACQACLRNSLKHALECGRLLNLAKEQCGGHGNWQKWCSDHFPASERTASNYMRLAKGWPEIEASMNWEDIADLTCGAALRLLTENQEEANCAEGETELINELDAEPVDDDTCVEPMKRHELIPYSPPRNRPSVQTTSSTTKRGDRKVSARAAAKEAAERAKEEEIGRMLDRWKLACEVDAENLDESQAFDDATDAFLRNLEVWECILNRSSGKHPTQERRDLFWKFAALIARSEELRIEENRGGGQA